MKKKLLSIISLLVAFVMCFTLVACNDNQNPSNGGPRNELPADKLIAAVEGLASSHGYKATVKTTRTSDGTTTPVTTETPVEKRGDVIKVAGGANGDTYYNIATGYAYKEISSGVYGYEQALPAGYESYLLDVLHGMLPDTAADKADLYATLKRHISYDGATKTGTYELSLSDIVNGLIMPVQEAYDNEMDTVEDLINVYLDAFVSFEDCKTLDGALTKLIEDYPTYKDKNLGEIIDTVDSTLGISVRSLLDSVGFGLPDDNWNMVRARKVGEVIAAALMFADSKLVATQDDVIDEGADEDGEGESDSMEMLVELINTLLFEAIDAEALEAVPGKLAQYKDLVVGLLGSMTVKQAVDAYGAMLPSDAVFLIKKGIMLTALDAKAEFTFDNDYNFSKITLDALCAHNYVVEAGDETEFFADNNYSFKIEVTFSDYTTEGAYTFNVAARQVNPGSVQLNAIVKAYSGDATYDLYYEEAGTVTVTDCKLYNTEGQEYAGTDDAIAYNASTKTFSVKYSALSSIIDDENFYTEEGGVIIMTANIEYDEGESYTLTVVLNVVKDASVQSAVRLSLPMIMSVMGGSSEAPGYGG